MKQIKEVIVDIESFINFINIKEKDIIIEYLNLQVKKNNLHFKLAIDFVRNTSEEVFFNDYKKIQNIEQVYTIICDFIHEYNNLYNHSYDLGFKSIVEKIKNFTTFNAEEEIKSSFIMEKINNNRMKHNFKILSFDQKRFNLIISYMIGQQIKKTGDFIDFDSKYNDLKLLKLISDPKKFFQIYKYFIANVLTRLETKDAKKVLLTKIIDNIFKNINEDIKNKKLNPNDDELVSFSLTYLRNLEIHYNDSTLVNKKANFSYKDFNVISKNYPNLYYYYLHNDSKASIAKFISTKNDIIENRLIEKNDKSGIINYLDNIFNELKNQKLTEEQIFKKMLNDYFKVIDYIKQSSHFVKFILLFQPKLEYLSYINTKNISVKIITNFENDNTNELSYSRGSYNIKEDLVRKYLHLLKQNGYDLSDVINKYPDLLKILNSINYYIFSKFFVDFYSKDEIKKNLSEIKKHKNIYYACVIFNYQKLKANDHFDLIKEDKDILSLFSTSKSVFFDVSTFLIQHEKDFPIVIDEFEEIITDIKSLLLYFYASRKKLSSKSEKIINSKETSSLIYKDILFKINNNKSLGYKSLKDFENSLVEMDEAEMENEDEDD